MAAREQPVRTVGAAVDAFLARPDLAVSSRRSYAQTLNRLASDLGAARALATLDAEGVQRDQRRVLNELLALLDELAANTIDRQLAKSDTQLGLEYLLGFGPPLPPRHRPT